MQWVEVGVLGPGLAICEIGLWTLALFIWLQRHNYTLAEAAALALLLSLMALSGLFQAAVLIGQPCLALIGEAMLTVTALGTLLHRRATVRNSLRSVSHFSRSHPVAMLIVGFGWAILGVQALLLPSQVSHLAWNQPAPPHPWGIPLQAVIDTHRLISTTSASLESLSGGNPRLYPLNSQILPLMSLRWGSNAGIGIIGYMAYLVIGFATYALARRYAWPAMALTVTAVTVSQPRLVWLSASPGHEILPAAAAVASLLVCYRAIECPSFSDLMLMVLCISFSMAPHEMGPVFSVILLLLTLVLLFRRHGVFIWGRLLRENIAGLIILIIPLSIYSQIWLFGYNLMIHGGWYGTIHQAAIPLNQEVLKGTIANLLRYFLESAHFAPLVDALWQAITGNTLSACVQWIHTHLLFPLFGTSGCSQTFVLATAAEQSRLWFGPLGFSVVQTAVLYALVRGSRRLKTIAVALCMYVYLVVLVVAWHPGNVCFFSVIYACGGFTVAFLLPPWRVGQRGQFLLQTISLVLLGYTCWLRFTS